MNLSAASSFHWHKATRNPNSLECDFWDHPRSTSQEYDKHTTRVRNRHTPSTLHDVATVLARHGHGLHGWGFGHSSRVGRGGSRPALLVTQPLAATKWTGCSGCHGQTCLPVSCPLPRAPSNKFEGGTQWSKHLRVTRRRYGLRLYAFSQPKPRERGGCAADFDGRICVQTARSPE